MMKPSHQLKQARDNYAFMTCCLELNTSTPGWQKTVMNVLNGIHGVYNFKMDDSGIVEVSGEVTPELLLKMLGKSGKKAKVLWWQFGECYSNLFMPVSYRDEMQYAGNGTHGYGIHGYNGGYGRSRYCDCDYYYGHGGDHDYHGIRGGINRYGYGGYGYKSGHGVTSCYDHRHPKPWYRPFIGSSHGNTLRNAANRQDHMACAMPRGSEGVPSCCTMM